MAHSAELANEEEVVYARAQLLGPSSDMENVVDNQVPSVDSPTFDDGQSAIASSLEEKQIADRVPKFKSRLWTPFFLRRPVVFVFVAVSLVIVAVAEILNAQSQRDQGLASVRPDLHYLWTFGPTAVFTALAAFWNQHDYQIRRNTPFIKMARSKHSAQDSILLDYLSPLDPQALLLSIRRKDWQVSLSILASVFLKVLIVLSTGIFVLRYPTRPLQVSLTLTDEFNFRRHPAVTLEAGTVSDNVFGPAVFNTSYPDGTNARYASQSFVAGKTVVDANSTIEADLMTVSGDLRCEQALWAASNRSEPYVDAKDEGLMKFDFWSDTLAASNVTLAVAPSWNIPIKWDMSRPKALVGVPINAWITDHTFDEAKCSSKNTSAAVENCYLVAFAVAAPYGYNRTDVKDPDDIIDKQPILPKPIGPVVKRQVARLPDGTFTRGLFQVVNMTAFLCQPTLVVAKARVGGIVGESASAAGVAVMRILEPIPLPFAGVDPWDYAQEVRNATLAHGLLVAASKPESAGFINTVPNMFDLMQLLARRDSYFDYLNPDLLVDTIREIFQRATAQHAKRYSAFPNQSEVTGSMLTIRPRLVVETLTLRLMDGFVIAFATCALAYCLFFSFPGLPRDFSSIGGLAMLIRQSPSVQRLCSGLGSVRLKHFNTWLRGYRFQTTYETTNNDSSAFNLSFQIRAELNPAIPEVETPVGIKHDIKWWRPAMFNWPLRILALVFPLALVTGLEYGLQYSNRHHGYGVVPEDGYLKYAWNFGPAIVMVATSSTFAALDFATRTFQPFHALASRRHASSNDLLESPFGHFAIISLVRSGVRKQWALAATSLVLCVSPFLAIMASALLQAEGVSIYQGQTATIHGTFVPNTTNRYDYHTDSSSGISSLLLYMNVTWPSLTFENVILPNFTIDDTTSRPTVSRFEISVPAAVVETSCTLVDPSSVSWTSSAQDDESNRTTFRVEGSVDLSSWEECTHSNKSTGFSSSTTTLPFIADTKVDLRGGLLPLEYVYGGQITTEFSDTTCDEQPFGYLYALIRNEYNVTRELRLINCRPRINIISVNATARTSDYQIANVTIPQDSVGSRRMFTAEPSQFENITFPCPPTARHMSSLGCPSEALAAHSQIDKADIFDSPQLAEAFEKLLDMLYAQRFNYWQRSTTEDTASSGVFFPASTKLEASMLDHFQYRVVQSRNATRALQALLGTMSFCALVAWMATKSKKVLTKDPQSIAAVASLLAGSDMLKDIPPGAEFMDDKQLRDNGVLHGGFYSIGWWGDERSRRFGIDIGTAEKPA